VPDNEGYEAPTHACHSRARPPNYLRMTDRSPRESNFAGAWVDPEAQQVFLVTKDVLLNQLKVAGPEIAESFDRVCANDLEAISELTALSITYATPGLFRARTVDDEVGVTEGALLQNSITSVTGSLSLLRQGFRLQAGMVARSTVEMLAVVFHLRVHPDDLRKIRSGEVKSSKVVTTAKKVLPPFGELYGLMSDQFVHVSDLHLSMQPLVEYSERDEAVRSALWAVQVGAWLTYVATELAYLDLVPRPRYWRSLGPVGFAWDPSDQERAWMTAFFGMDLGST
jgi:hypothetical protein